METVAGEIRSLYQKNRVQLLDIYQKGVTDAISEASVEIKQCEDALGAVVKATEELRAKRDDASSGELVALVYVCVLVCMCV